MVLEPVPKLIGCALTRTVLGQAFAVFQAFGLAKLRNLKLLSQNFSFGKASLYKSKSYRKGYYQKHGKISYKYKKPWG
jgi:hypothetical protein